MVSRRPVFPLLFVLISLIGLSAAWATPPVLVSAVSRMKHGTAGSFDVMLPLTGGSGIECRNTSVNGMQIVATFDQTITGGTASITGGTATISGTPTISGATITVNLTAVADAQAVTLSLSNVTNGTDAPSSATVPFRTLFADINGDGNLTATDVSLCRGAIGSGASVNAGNFRNDLNADGQFNSTDISLLRSAVGAGASLAGGPTNNTPPTITTIATQSVVTGTVMSPVGFTVGDAESSPSSLTVIVSSSDQITIPNGNITLGGSGASRTITLTPAAGITSVVPVTISMYVSDGLAYSSVMSFTVNVTPPPTVYLATLTPIAGTGSLGSGSATLTVSGDTTYASLRYSYSNLSSNDTDDAVYNSSAQVMYDIPVGKLQGNLQSDGSYLWTFNATKAAAILASIQSNTSYILLESANFPAGELTGTFKLVSGSQTFTPPAAPPSITINPPTPADASRFMQQAAFGGNSAEIAALSNTSASNASTALNDWLTAQFAMPGPIYPTYAASSIAPTTQPLTAQSASQPYTASSMYYQIYNRVTIAQAPNAYGDSLADDRVHESWYKNAVTGPDELRQRIATAYSEIFVVSEIDDTIDGNIPGLASYYDMLADDAFVNFRQLLGDITLHPIMGNYLNMQGNLKTAPNENYAREVMQLFSIGLYMLQPDGTLMLDSNGQPIPTYTQPTVTSFASVYTGWNTSAHVTIPTLIAPVAPATQPTISNFTSYYQSPMVVTAANHSTIAKPLLNYTGAATYPAATQPAYIPATTTQTATTATAELNFALDNIFNHPNVGPFICKQLIQRLVESNPSPAYVYRVAQVFNNDGTGVRGNMQAVITAILTDYEARSPAVQTNAGYGHMREPIIRIADILHSCNAVSKSGKWTVGKTDNTLAQTIFRSPTVFNFFSPTYTQPGVVQQAGLVSPEFDIIYETTVTNSQNMIYTGIYANYNTDGSPKLTGTGFRGDAYGSDVYLNFSASGSNLLPLATTPAGSSSAMLNQVVLLLNGPSLDTTNSAQPRIQTFLNTLPNTNPLAQVEAAVQLVATSPQCAAER
jgi:uncharacterized protein (DUF1800 family)